MNENDYFGMDGSRFKLDTIKTAYDLSTAWNDEFYEVRNHLANEYTNQSDKEILNQLKKMINEPKTKTKEERVVDIIKGGFEKHFNMTIKEFQSIYEEMLETNPEKLV